MRSCSTAHIFASYLGVLWCTWMHSCTWHLRNKCTQIHQDASGCAFLLRCATPKYWGKLSFIPSWTWVCSGSLLHYSDSFGCPRRIWRSIFLPPEKEKVWMALLRSICLAKERFSRKLRENQRCPISMISMLDRLESKHYRVSMKNTVSHWNSCEQCPLKLGLPRAQAVWASYSWTLGSPSFSCNNALFLVYICHHTSWFIG